MTFAASPLARLLTLPAAEGLSVGRCGLRPPTAAARRSTRSRRPSSELRTVRPSACAAAAALQCPAAIALRSARQGLLFHRLRWRIRPAAAVAERTQRTAKERSRLLRRISSISSRSASKRRRRAASPLAPSLSTRSWRAAPLALRWPLSSRTLLRRSSCWLVQLSSFSTAWCTQCNLPSAEFHTVEGKTFKLQQYTSASSSVGQFRLFFTHASVETVSSDQI